jgi:WD40-like Beta Propeller Repeat
MTQPLGRQSVAHEAFNDVIRDVANREGVLLIDLEQELSRIRSSAFLSDQIHLNDYGSQFIGKLIANALASFLTSSLVKIDAHVERADLDHLLKACRAPPPPGEPFTPGKPHKILEFTTGRYPSFSPDGRFILFHDWQAGRERIKAVDLRSHKLIELTPEDSVQNERHPTFLSYNATDFQIVFGATTPGPGKELEQLTVRHWPSMQTSRLMNESIGGAIPAVRSGHVYFPGFGSEASNNTPDLYQYDLQRKTISRLTATPWEEWRPAIASDGTVFFIGNRDGRFNIFEMKRSKAHPELVQESSADQWDPALSPDDRWLAFASKLDGNWDLFLLDRTDRSPAVQLTFEGADQWDPAFHPNGRLLLFAASSGQAPHIFAICPFGE